MNTSERLVQIAEERTKRKFERLTASMAVEETGSASFDSFETLFLNEDVFGAECGSSESNRGGRSNTVGDRVAMVDSLPQAAQPKLGPVPLPCAT